MKKTLLILSALLLVFSLTAQSKDQVLKDIEKAKVATENPKKAANPSTWIKLAEAYIDAYQLPFSNLRIGSSEVEEKIFLKDQKMISSESVELSGQMYKSKTYDDKKLYYNDKGILEVIQITKPVSQENFLELAYEALMQAGKADVKGKKKDDIKNTFKRVREIYVNEGLSQNTLGDVKKACDNFESSLKFSNNPYVNSVDSIITYYTALTAKMIKDFDRAQKYYEKCLEVGYDQKGECYSGLAEIYKANGNEEKSKEILNQGFIKYPNSQSILVALINLYLETNDDPNKVLDLIRTAQKNEPNNASLYLAEGNVYKEMKDYENTMKCYEKSNEIDPKYVAGLYFAGATYYEIAVEIQEKINALDVNNVTDYEKLSKELDSNLKKSIPYFERTFAGSEGDLNTQKAAAEYLKLIYFRFREENSENQAHYDKYNNFLIENSK